MSAAAELPPGTEELEEENDPGLFLTLIPERIFHRIFGRRALSGDPKQLSRQLGESLARAVLRVHESLKDSRISAYPNARHQISNLRQWILETMNFYQEANLFPDILTHYEARLASESLPEIYREIGGLPEPLDREVEAVLRDKIAEFKPQNAALEGELIGECLGAILHAYSLHAVAFGEMSGLVRAEEVGLSPETLENTRRRVLEDIRRDPFGQFRGAMIRLQALEVLTEALRSTWGSSHPLLSGLENQLPRENREELRDAVDRVKLLMWRYRPDLH